MSCDGHRRRLNTMIASAIDIRPPAPRPCTARNTISWPIDCDSPAVTDPTMNTTIAIWNMILRP